MARVNHPEHVQDEVVKAYLAGLSIAAVADQFGMSTKFVSKLTKRRGVFREESNRLPDEFRDQVAELRYKGKSFREIAEALGVTKGIISGLFTRDEGLRAIGAAAKSGPRKGQAKPDQPTVKRDGLPVLKAEAIAYDATARLVSLVKRENGACCFPIGDPKDEAFGYCGHTLREDSAYCAHHHRRMFKAEAA